MKLKCDFRILVCFVSNLFWIDSIFGQQVEGETSPDRDSSKMSIVASPVTVYASAINLPYTVSRIDGARITLSAAPSIEPLLNATPGLWMQSGALNTNRISIRGVGYREPFATTGIKIYLDEIPLTNGVGESSIEDIHPGILSGIDIWRGPASALWGSGLGGMIHLKSVIPEEDQIGTKLQGGSFDRLQVDQHLSFRYGEKKAWGTALHYQYLNDAGYRDNNHYRKHSLSWLQQWRGEKGLTINALVHAIGLKAFIPSSLNLEDYESNPSAAAPTWAAVMGDEDYTKWITGLNVTYAPASGWVYKGSVFGTFFNSDEVRPFNVLNENNSAAGMRHRFAFRVKDSGHITVGMEYFNEQYAFSTYETLEGGIAGQQLTDEDEARTYLNAFLQTEWTIGRKWFLFGGLNAAVSRLSGAEVKAETPVDFFPSIGASYKWLSNLTVAASVSRGYSSLSLDDVLDSDGNLNPDIVPETGWSEEISLRFDSRKGSFAKLTLFNMHIQNTVLTRRIMDDVFEKINGGSSLHQGIEVEYKWIDNGQRFFIEGAYTFGDYTFDEFVEGGNDYSGNQLPGTSLHHTYNRLGIWPSEKWNVHLDHHWISDVYLNDANTIAGKGYQLINAGLSYLFITTDKWEGSVGAGVHNLLDVHYSPMFQINAPGANPRYYYPGKPFSIYLDVGVTCNL